MMFEAIIVNVFIIFCKLLYSFCVFLETVLVGQLLWKKHIKKYCKKVNAFFVKFCFTKIAHS